MARNETQASTILEIINLRQNGSNINTKDNKGRI